MSAPASEPTPAYPIRPLPEDDARFCNGLTLDVADVLVRYGYPPLTHWADLLELRMALYRFLYSDDCRLPGQWGGAA